MRWALVLVLLAGCVRFQYLRRNVGEPVSGEQVQQLVQGDDLAHCLELLGPPRLIWKDPRGIWFAYIWINERGPSLSFSLPTEGLIPSPSLSYSRTKRLGKGVVLLFDRDFKLVFYRRGLTDLPPEEPSLLDFAF